MESRAASQTPSREGATSTKPLAGTFVKRPLNSFMLYRKAKQHDIDSNNHQSISRIIGEMWRNESADVKSHYDKLAKEERRRHQEEHPDYKFKPKKRPISKLKTISSYDARVHGARGFSGPGAVMGGWDPRAPSSRTADSAPYYKIEDEAPLQPNPRYTSPAETTRQAMVNSHADLSHTTSVPLEHALGWPADSRSARVESPMPGAPSDALAEYPDETYQRLVEARYAHYNRYLMQDEATGDLLHSLAPDGMMSLSHISYVQPGAIGQSFYDLASRRESDAVASHPAKVDAAFADHGDVYGHGGHNYTQTPPEAYGMFVDGILQLPYGHDFVSNTYELWDPAAYLPAELSQTLAQHMSSDQGRWHFDDNDETSGPTAAF